jgi:hypothetical protein
LTSLNVVQLVQGHGGLRPGFALDRLQKLLENQNIHHFEINRIHRNGAFAGKVTLTKQSKSSQSQRKPVNQEVEPSKSKRKRAHQRPRIKQEVENPEE